VSSYAVRAELTAIYAAKTTKVSLRNNRWEFAAVCGVNSAMQTQLDTFGDLTAIFTGAHLIDNP
jgi:hypothetical protein